MMVRFVFVILILLSIRPSYAQHLSYQHYGMEDGLASNKTFDLATDSAGYIWISTENGINKFDGKGFEVFNQKSGLNSSDIVEMCFDEKGNLWAEGFKMGLQVLRNDSVIKPNIHTGKIGQYKHLTFFNGNIYFINASIDRRPYFIKKENIYPITNIPISDYLYVTDDHKLLVGTSNGIYIIEAYRAFKVNIPGLNKKKIHSIVTSKNIMWVGADNELLKIINNKVVAQYPTMSPVTKLILDHDGGLWFGMRDGGAGCLLEEQMGSIMQLLDSDLPVSDILVDKQNSVWIGTYGSGIYQFNNKFMIDYSGNNSIGSSPVLGVYRYKDSGVLIGFDEYIITLNPDNTFKKISIPKLFPAGFVYQPSTIYIVGQSTLFPRLKTIQNNNPRIIYTFGTASYFELDSILYTCHVGILYKHILNNKTPKELSTLIFDKNRRPKVYSITKVKDTLWLSTTGPLYKIYNNTIETFDHYNGIKHIVKDKNDNLYLASSNGLLKLNLEYKVETTFFAGHQIKCASINDDEIWVGTSNGIIGYKNKRVVHLSSHQGLPNNNINCLYSKGPFLWVGTDKGLCKVNREILWNRDVKPPLRLFLSSIETLKDTINSPVNDLRFSSKTDYLKFNFSSINFLNNNQVVYQYALDGKNWITIENPSISLPLLKYGEHNIQLRAHNYNSEWSYSKKLDFTIEPPFTQTYSFSILIILLVLGSAGITYFLFRRKQVKKLAVANEITELKHRSLHAMMNPHFIFNSLSSIQYFVTTKQEKKANIYISKLAHLIRINLSHSIKNDVSISDEITFIELYLELEQTRFSENICYEIQTTNLSQDAKDKIKIPALLIQPLLENAIIHGILPSQNKGFISILFSYNAPLLSITITDNGVGYNANNKKTNHKSLGISVLETRIRLRNKRNSSLNSFTIENVIENNKITGTKAVISLSIA